MLEVGEDTDAQHQIYAICCHWKGMRVTENVCFPGIIIKTEDAKAEFLQQYAVAPVAAPEVKGDCTLSRSGWNIRQHGIVEMS